jgi:hypothetical protein
LGNVLCHTAYEKRESDETSIVNSDFCLRVFGRDVWPQKAEGPSTGLTPPCLALNGRA